MNRRSTLEITILSGFMLIGIVAFSQSLSPSASSDQSAAEKFAQRLDPFSLAQIPAQLRVRPPETAPQALPKNSH